MSFSHTDLPNPDGVPKIRGYAIKLHGQMVLDSVVNDGAVVWQGSVAGLFRLLDIPQGYHTPILRLLNQTACLEQVKRGSRNQPSVYVLLRDPATLAEDDWPSISSIVKSKPVDLTNSAASVTLLSHRLDAVEKQVKGLDIRKALIDLQAQITELQTSQKD